MQCIFPRVKFVPSGYCHAYNIRKTNQGLELWEHASLTIRGIHVKLQISPRNYKLKV